MTSASDGSLTGDIVARLRIHWPEAEVTAESVDDDLRVPSFVRVRVGDGVYLDAAPGELTWVAQPMLNTSGQIRPAVGQRSYSIGVTTAEGADAVADRFYEEVRFWWARLHAPGFGAGRPA